VIKLHPECYFIATCNVGPEFTAVNSMDAAFEARFGIIPFDYAPAKEEMRLLKNKTKATKNDIELIITVANEIRALYKAGELSKGVGFREVEDAAQMAEDGIPLSQALEFAFVTPYPMDEKATVKDILSGH